jgi:hypothetical protein
VADFLQELEIYEPHYVGPLVTLGFTNRDQFMRLWRRQPAHRLEESCEKLRQLGMGDLQLGMLLDALVKPEPS